MELINREEVIKKIAKQWEYEDEKGLNRDYEYFYECAEIWLEDIPTIESRPKGKWIKRHSYDRRDNFYACSECGRIINIICGAHLEDYPFCHCGADMRGEK